ncbi:hypothetical protein DFH28DRAFT_1077542 [Melampsora americana]|nr:hypothetical protein DFH28DRAFT_1077542 [Melampsora americana]
MLTHEFVTRTRPFIEEQAVAWCQYLTKMDITPKEVIHAFLSAPKNNVLIDRRRIWAASTGWRSTLDILHDIKNLAKSTKAGSEGWKSFILEEAKECLKEDMDSKPRSYFSSNKITPGFFDMEQMEARNSQIQNDIPFLYALLYNLLSTSTSSRGFLSAGAPTFDIWDDEETSLQDDDEPLDQRQTCLGEHTFDESTAYHDGTEYAPIQDFDASARSRASLVSDVVLL